MVRSLGSTSAILATVVAMWTTIDPESGYSFGPYSESEADARELLAALKEEWLYDIRHDLFGQEARKAAAEAHRRFKKFRTVEFTEEQRRFDNGETPS